MSGALKRVALATAVSVGVAGMATHTGAQSGNSTITSAAISAARDNASAGMTLVKKVKKSKKSDVKEIALANGGVEDQGVQYCPGFPGVPSSKLTEDVYHPPANVTNGPTPVEIDVHGGGWAQSNPLTNSLWPATLGAYVLTSMVSNGVTVVSLNYSGAPGKKFPVQEEEVKCAVRSVEANAAVLGIDPTRIGLMGDSAGGQLVTFVEMTPNLYNVGPYLSYSSTSNLKFVISLSGIYSIPALASNNRGDKVMAKDAFGNASNQIAGSPDIYISPGIELPPNLAIWASKDTTAPYWEQAGPFIAKMNADGQNVTSVEIDANHDGGGLSPAGQIALDKQVENFGLANLQRTPG